jgi:orotate phosphoribosyltransferase
MIIDNRIVWPLIFSVFSLSADCTTLIPLFEEHHIIRHGEFVLKSGQSSNFYVDMRMALSSPTLMHELGQMICERCQQYSYDRVCGVPYGAIPFATICAYLAHAPLIMLRKEVKEHGTCKRIEGSYTVGDRVVLIEDVVTTGSSILDSIHMLEEQGLSIAVIVILFDRQQGGKEMLESLGYSVEVIVTLDDIAQKQRIA